MSEVETSRATRWAIRVLRTRWLVRAPIWLFRARLGVLLGRRFLLLEHIGRTSGARRFVVLEVIDRAPGRLVVVSGFGAASQWYRNICATPQVRITVGSRQPVAAIAATLAQPDTAAALQRYRAAHPRAWAQLRPVLEGVMKTRIDESASGVTAVEFDVQAGDSDSAGTTPRAPGGDR